MAGEGDDRGEMVGWHHRLDGCQFEQALGDSEGQGSLACCSPWGRKSQTSTATTIRTLLMYTYKHSDSFPLCVIM